MFDIFEAKRKKADILKRQRELLETLDKESRKATEEENTEYRKLDAEVEQLERDILDAEEDQERRRKLAEKELAAQKAPAVRKATPAGQADVDPDKEFRNIGEMFWAIAAEKVDHRRDARLDVLREQRAQSMGTGSEGGFALPTQFRDTILQVSPQEAIVRPRATVIPAGNPPDAKLEMPALDQTAASNVYGGVTITHTGEAITMTETSAALRQVTLEPKEMSAYIVTTNKLLNNWEAASSFITTQLRTAMIGAEDYDFLRGDGINKSLGVSNAPATITVGRSAANTIAWADIIGLYARAKQGGNLAWIASPTTIPQLVTIVDAGSHSLWVGGVGANMQGAAGSLPPTLMGIPVLFGERNPALGTSGDILLADLSYYLIKDGSGPFAALSTELLFLSNRTVFRLVWNVDARPWLTEAIALEGSSTSTVSPFVKLS